MTPSTTLVAFALTAVVFCGAQTVGPGPECFCYEPITQRGAMFNPTAIKHAGDGSNRLFVSEQRGVIWTFSDNVRNPTPFVNLTETDLHVETYIGLLGFAFHPNFASNGQVYLHFSVRHSGYIHQRISEMTLSATDPDQLDITTERVLIEARYPPTYKGHHGGMMNFGDDGYLYFGIGDGACCTDPLENGQNKTNLFAAVSRIDVDNPQPPLPYGIPADNPFIDDPEAIPELYAYGIRQPFSADVDRGDKITGEGKGRIFVGDVGDAWNEEIDLLEAGGNYGWSAWEGDYCHQPTVCDTMGPVVTPILQYNHSLGICIFLAGMYRGCEIPDLEGWLLYMDYNTIFLGGRQESETVWSSTIIPACPIEQCLGNSTNEFEIALFCTGFSEKGEVYFGGSSTLAADNPGGTLWKVVDPNNPGAPCP